MALRGIKFSAYPTSEQQQTLSQWMGSARGGKRKTRQSQAVAQAQGSANLVVVAQST